jgi:pectinesterase/pectate lyase
MLSATGLAAAIAILAITVNVVDDDALTPGAEAADHVVAADGSTDFDTIQAAVDAAADGDTIAVLPGTYTEAVVIDKDLTLFGDGPREQIVLIAPADGPERDIDFAWLSAAPYALLLLETDGEVRDLTLAGEASRLFVEGGAPMVSGMLFDQVGRAYEGSAVAGAVNVQHQGRPTFTGNQLVGGGGMSAYSDSNPIFEGNLLDGSGTIDGDFGDDAVIRDNTIIGPGRQGITFLGATSALVVGNTVRDKDWGITTGEGINVTVGTNGSTFEPTIEGNTITGTGRAAINLVGGSPIVADNTLADGSTGISLARSFGTVSGNDVSGFEAGVVVVQGGGPTLTDNTITGNGRGLATDRGGTELTLSGNTICDNETNLRLLVDQEVETEGNEICEDAAPAE